MDFNFNDLRDKASMLADKFTMKGAIVEAAQKMLPGVEKMLIDRIQNMEDPEHESFALPEGFHKITYNVVSDGSRLMVSLHAIKVNKDGTATLGSPLDQFYLTEMLQMQINGK